MSIRLKDNSPVPTGYEARCQAIQELAGQGRCSLIDLRGKTEDYCAKRPQIFQRDAEGTWWTRNLIGVFEYQTGDGSVEEVVIGDRLGPVKLAGGGTGGEFLSFFSWSMLNQCWDETPLWLLNESRSRNETDVFDQILMLRLAVQMERAWKKGRLRFYHTISQYDCRVQGQIDLPRKIRMSMGLEDGRMACRVREYSENNQYSQLFFQACLQAEWQQPKLMRRLKQNLPGFRMARQALEQQAARGWGVRDLRSLLSETRKKITNPLYRDYEALRGIARAVLIRTSRSYCYSEAGAPFVTGIFLDVSTLWEDYLCRAVFSGLSSRPRTQGNNEEKIGILDEMLYAKPDFWWKGERRVLDAKFRPVWGKFLKPASLEKDRKKIRQDAYQVLSYMLALDCTRGGVIFPVKGGHSGQDPYRKVRAVNGSEEREFWLIPFFVPQTEDYADFSGAMLAEAGEVRNAVNQFLIP